MRRLIVLTLLLGILAGALLLNLLVARAQPAVVYPPALADGHGLLMANIDLAGMTPAQAAQQISWAAEDGARYARIRLPWNEIQPQPDAWNWQTADEAVAAAGSLGLEIVLLLDGAPAWAIDARDAANPLAPPHDVRDFGYFAEQVAARYGDRVQIYQIWDEPNIAPHWGAGPVDAQGYYTLLREGANSIRRVDPDAAIMLATLAPTTADDYGNLSDLSYLDRLYQLGAAAQFDMAAAAAYGFDQPPDAAPAPDRLNFRRPELLAEIMRRNGDADKPLWITAWGWWTPAAGQALTDSPWKGVTADTLAPYLGQGLNLARAQWPWAGPMAWVESALSPGEDTLRSGFVLRQDDGQRTAAGVTLAAGADPPILLGTGAHSLDHPAIDATDWRTSTAAADPNQDGAELTTTIRGRSAALEIQRGPYRATLFAWIDGQPAPLLPKDTTGASYVALYGPENGVAVVPLADDLAAGEHELRLVAAGGWGQWFLRRIIIDHESWPQPWPFWPITAALVLGLILTMWLWIAAARSGDGRNALAGLSERWEALAARVREHDRGWQLWLAILIVVLFYLAPGLPLSLIGLMALAVVLALRLDLAPALVLVALPLAMHPKALGPIGIPLHEIVIWMAFGLWVLHWFLVRFRPSPPPISRLQRLDYPIALLLLMGFFATLAADRRGFALYDFRTVFLTPALFYWLLTRIERQRPLDLPMLSDSLVIGALLLAMVAIAQLFGGSYDYVEGVPRVSALFGSANNLALYLGRVIPLLIVVAALSIFARTVARSPRSWLYLLALVPIGVAALLTFSKGLLLISVPVGLLTLAFFEKRLRRPILILFALGLLALIPLFRTERFADLLNTDSGTTFLRLQLWQSAWQMWRDHPWLGVGPDNFLYQYRSIYALPTAWEEINLNHPHNLFLDLLTRLGFFGLIAGLWLIITTILSGYKLLRPRNSELRTQNIVLLGLYAGLVAGLGHGLIDNSLFLPELMVLTLLVVGVVQRRGEGQEGVKYQ